jgi:glutamine amidotransferase
MIGILDYGMGNVGSIQNMLKRLSIDCRLENNPVNLGNYHHLILPGVGSYDSGIAKLTESGFREKLDRVVKKGIPILGICLGMQLLGQTSEEGELNGLGWINAKVIRFQQTLGTTSRIKVPHMGWNTVSPREQSNLFAGLEINARFYFVHSYHMVCKDSSDVQATVLHGVEVVAAVKKDNVFGVQFHPEKSHKFGMKLLENFSKC